MKKLLAVLLAGTMLVSIAGCGGKKVDDNGKTVVTLWTNITDDSEPEEIAYQKMIEERIAEEFPQYDVRFVQKVYTDYNQDYDKALMAGNAPDAFDMFSYTAIPTRIKNGTIADITDLVNEWVMKKEDKVINTFDEIINKEDKWYAVPRHAYTMALYVNKKAIKSGGEDPENLPKTWDEFDAYCQKITDRSLPRFGYELMGMDYCAWPFTAWVWSAGGEMVEPAADGKWRIAFADDPGVDAATYLNKLATVSKVTQQNILCPLSDTDNDMMTDKACFAWGTLANVNAKTIADLGSTMDDFTQIAMPVKDASIPNPALAGGEVITLNPKADPETKKAAFEVMTFIHYDEELQLAKWQAEFDNGSSNIHIPARKDLYEKKLQMNPVLNEESRANILKLSETAIPEPYCEHWSELKTQLIIPLQKIYLTEGLSRDDIKKILSDCADELVRLYPETFER